MDIIEWLWSGSDKSVDLALTLPESILHQITIIMFFIILKLTLDRDELRTMFDRALTHVSQLGGDPNCVLARYWSSLEADIFHNMEDARNMWQGVLQAAGERTKFWLEYIQVKRFQLCKC